MLHKFRVPNFGTQEGRKDMTQKVKRIVALILSMLMILSSVTVYAADDNADTQQTGHTLTVNVAGEGYVEVSGEGITESADNSYSVPPATTVTVTATPGEGMQLSGITLDGVIQSESFLMPDHDAVLDITFEAVPQPANVEEDNETVEAKPEPETAEEPADTGETARVERNVNTVVPTAEKIEPGIDLSSYVMLATTRSSGIPSVGDQVTGSCYIGDTWNVNYPYQDYFYVSDFSGDLAGAVTVQDFECLDPTAALPSHTWASYVATVTEVNLTEGYIEYSVRITPPGATDGTTDGSGHLTGYQHVGGKVRVTREFVGAIELQKSSANPDLTNGNSCYSLAGAVYGVYSGNDKIAELTTDSNGYARVDNIPAGSYVIKEITAPKGYALDVTGHNVTVTSGQTATLRVTDLPQSDPASVLLGKIDAETTQNMPQGSASLEGAEFTFKYYDVISDTDPAEDGEEAVRTWVMRTDEDGFTYLNDEYKISGDDFYYMSAGQPTLPLGTLTIQETKAPKGYLINDEVYIRPITAEGTLEGVNTYNAPTIPEDVIRGDIQIVKYGENNAETDDSSADIKRPLEGVKFHLTSKTTQEVYTIITDEQGVASTTQLVNDDDERGGIPFDTYVITEESPYPEYDPVAPFEVTISEEGQTLYYILRNDTVDAPIRIQKLDETTGKVIPVAGAQFQILDSEKNVISMTVSHYPSLVEIDTFETDASGSFTLPEKLEYGTYYLREVQAPEGYLLGGEDIKFVVDQEYQWDNPLTVQYADAPAIGRIEIIKTDSETGDPLEGAEFTVTAAEDITTPDGTVRAAAGDVVDTITSNKDGTAISKNLYLGKYTVAETKQPAGYILPDQTWEVELTYKDQNTELVTETLEVENDATVVIIDKKVTGSEQRLSGVKFAIWNKDTEDPVDPGMTYKDIYKTDREGKIRLERFVPGTYCIREVQGVPGYAIDSTIHEFTIDEDGRVNGQAEITITIENAKTEIVETNALNLDTGDQNAYPKQINATDTVSINSLQPEMEYTLTWVVADALTGQPLREGDLLTGDLITGEQIFTATEAQMDIVQDISFDASEFAGRTLVIYEYLYQEDILISEHTDPDDAKQQLYIRNPELHTTAIDVESGTHEAIAKDNVTIRDIVDHFDILPGTYTLRGIVMDQATGKPLQIDGKMITAEKEIQVTEEVGTVNMEFSFDASELNNRSIVIYEYLYQDNELITSHEDINDKDQTITFKVGKLTVDMPGNDGSGIALKTGDDSAAIFRLISTILIAISIIGMIVAFKGKGRKKSENKE